MLLKAKACDIGKTCLFPPSKYCQMRISLPFPLLPSYKWRISKQSTDTAARKSPNPSVLAAAFASN